MRCSSLGLRPGDYLQVEVAQGRVVFTPKTLVDKRLDQRIAESMNDFAQGRSYGPFESAGETSGCCACSLERLKKQKPLYLRRIVTGAPKWFRR